MGLLLALVRRISDAAAAMRRGEWDRKRFEGTELRGKTMGVVGLGRIGGHLPPNGPAPGPPAGGDDPDLSPQPARQMPRPALSPQALPPAAARRPPHPALGDPT